MSAESKIILFREKPRVNMSDMKHAFKIIYQIFLERLTTSKYEEPIIKSPHTFAEVTKSSVKV